MEIESTLERVDQAQQRYARLEHSNCLLTLCTLGAFGCFAVCLAIGMASHWLLSGFGLYMFLLCGAGLLICGSIIGWHIHGALLDRKQKVQDIQQGDYNIAVKKRFIRAADRAETNGDNYKMVVGEKSITIEVIRKDTQLEHARIQYAPRPQIAGPALQPIPSAPPAPDDENEEPIPIPVAPNFWDMIHLITQEQMPLCFVVDMNPQSPTFLQTVPAFGTILDLLSLCVIGKPGKGKSVLLLFYICCLAKYGAEMHVLDPQGAFKELMLLHGRMLPAMPATARIYYYSTLKEMEAAVSNVLDEIDDREELFQPHLEHGEVVFNRLKHPLVVLADELPIIAEMDVEIKQKTKEENKARKADGLESLKIRQVTDMVKTSVLAARKYNVYFVGASQSIDATILPTRVTAGFNSRIVFSSTEQKARMAGLESADAKRLLPVIRRAGSGKMIYDCGRWDAPLIAAIPMLTIEDVLRFFGLSMEELREMWRIELLAREQQRQETRITGPLHTPPSLPVVQEKKSTRRATITDAIEVWNEAITAGYEIGRPRLRDELVARGLECTDDLAKNLLKSIKHQLEKQAGGTSDIQGDENG